MCEGTPGACACGHVCFSALLCKIALRLSLGLHAREPGPVCIRKLLCQGPGSSLTNRKPTRRRGRKASSRRTQRSPWVGRPGSEDLASGKQPGPHPRTLGTILSTGLPDTAGRGLAEGWLRVGARLVAEKAGGPQGSPPARVSSRPRRARRAGGKKNAPVAQLGPGSSALGSDSDQNHITTAGPCGRRTPQTPAPRARPHSQQLQRDDEREPVGHKPLSVIHNRDNW